MRLQIVVVAALVLSAAWLKENVVMAGYSVITNYDSVKNTDIGKLGPSVGDSFSISNGTFLEFVANTPADIPITPPMLAAFGYTVQGTITGFAGTETDYSGVYEIFFNTDGNHSRNPGDLRISSGTFTATSLILPLLNIGGFNGHLTQVLGPQVPWLPNLGFNTNPVPLVGTYFAVPIFNMPAFMQTVFGDNSASVPEPSSMVLLAVGLIGVGLFARRRRR